MFRILVLAVMIFVAADVYCQQPRSDRIPLLIVDGQNNHDWPRATRILKEILDGSGLFAVDVATSPAADAPKAAWDRWRPEFAKYRVVVSNFNGEHLATSVHWPTEVEKALEDYVANGGGLVVYHSANNSFPNWPAYNEMIGLGWRPKDSGPSLVVGTDEKVVEIPKDQGRNPGHGPEHVFQVTTLDTNHPITKDLPKKWMHPHEQLTHGQHGPAHNLTVLTYAWSKDVKENEPMDWVVSYGKGRVYTTMLGHLWKGGSDAALRCVGFRTLCVRGCQWAATGEVSYPVPQDFPTADKVALADACLPLEVQARKATDRIEVRREGENVLLEMWSPSGIGSAAITPRDGKWPGAIVLRLHLRGLESLVVSNDRLKLTASVLSHSGNARRLHLTEEGRQGESDPGTEIRVLDAAGKPIQGLPGKGGCFELVLPKVMLERQPKRLNLEWIDFYRG